jgi:hypothetical protein
VTELLRRLLGRVGRLGRLALDGRLAAAVDRDLDAVRLALDGLRDADLEDAVGEARGDLLGVDAVRQRQRALERARGALDADVAALALLVRGLALPATVRTPSLTSSLTSSCFMPGRSAERRKWSSCSTRSIAGIQRRTGAALPAVVGVSKKVLNRRFISDWIESSSRTGSQRTRAMVLTSRRRVLMIVVLRRTR